MNSENNTYTILKRSVSLSCGRENYQAKSRRLQHVSFIRPGSTVASGTGQ